MSIEIHLDGKPVTKLQAARALSIPDSLPARVGEPDEDGYVNHGFVSVWARHHVDGELLPSEVSWPSYGSVSAADARTFAGQVALGAEIAELAEMLAAEQDAGEAAPPKWYVGPCIGEAPHRACGSPEACDCACHVAMWKKLDRATPGYPGTKPASAAWTAPRPLHGFASCGHPANEDGECDCSSWPERAPIATAEAGTGDDGELSAATLYDPDSDDARAVDGEGSDLD
jgi:hypothetical protein